jgi:hypothetical protein
LSQSSEVLPEDRLPTLNEVQAFDAAAAWHRLSPPEQRRIGILAVRVGTVGQRLSYRHDDFICAERRLIECREGEVLSDFFDAVEPLWQVLFGWVSPRWAKPAIREVA